MANDELLKVLQEGAEAWGKWRAENPYEHIDFSKAVLDGLNLSGVNLRGVDFSKSDFGGTCLYKANLEGANLSGANVSGISLIETNLRGANLSRANLGSANFSGADLSWTDLFEAYLNRAYLIGADLRGVNLSLANLSEAKLMDACLYRAKLGRADLRWADLSGAILIRTNLENATLNSCRVYGISAWELKLKDAMQRDLIITPQDEPVITVDNLEVAQFIYLLLHNEKIRDVIATVAKKAVLILGRFTPERRVVLGALKDELRKRDYLPISFDFEKSEDQDIAQTVSTLAHMARFIIADITYAKSIPSELQLIVPNLPTVPVAPIILESDYKYALFERIMMYNSVLEPFRYRDQETLLISIAEKVIKPLEEKRGELKNKLDEVRNNS